MLRAMGSRELAEWIAFERRSGPIGGGYQEVVLREILDQIRYLNYMTGGQFEDNPVPRPSKSFPSPEEYMHLTPPDDEPEEPKHATPDEIDSFLGF